MLQYVLKQVTAGSTKCCCICNLISLYIFSALLKNTQHPLRGFRGSWYLFQLRSKSKLLGHILSSHTPNVGELTAINNIERTRRRARRGKNADLLAIDKTRYFAQPRPITVKQLVYKSEYEAAYYPAHKSDRNI